MTDSIMGVEFAHPRFPTLGLEALTLSDLRGRAPPEHFQRPQRPAFHTLLLVQSGHGWHSLDFQAIPCAPGTLLHVRPGQVQQFDMQGNLEAAVILFRPDLPLLEAPRPEAPLVDCVIPQGTTIAVGPALEAVADGFSTVCRNHTRTIGTQACAAILQHLLQALLLRLALLDDPDAAWPNGRNAHLQLFRHFRRLLEVRLTQGWAIADYARTLTVSERTLTRVCTAISGKPPARLVEARLLLEAKRLLAHSDLKAADIANHLGFDEPTNFSKFFRRLAGTTPLEFRASQRRMPGQAAPPGQ